MRFLGFLLIAIGLGLIIYMGYSWWQGQGKLVSPIPDERGVKVIFITPSK
jgi:hypothetical protein